LQAVINDLNRRIKEDEILIFAESMFGIDSYYLRYGAAYKGNDHSFIVQLDSKRVFLAFAESSNKCSGAIRWVRKLNFNAPSELLYEYKI
jgi:hypothetical protein